jgi:uncharacterized protein YdaU (DUF1376 family)
VNFYKHHIGDYATATSHLSFIEDGAYSRLIRRYYSTEQPLPEDPQTVARLVGARSKAEGAAVTAMLQEFFVLEDDGWHQRRCDEEIEAAQGKAERNREIGKLGGRPHKTETRTVSKQKPNGNPNGLHSKPKHNPLQTPVTSNHKPVTQTPDSEPISKSTPTLPVSSSVRAAEEPEKGSVCGTFTKIGGEGKPMTGEPKSYPSAEEIMDELRREHRRAGK